MATAKKVKGISPKHSLRESAQRIIITRFGEMMSYKEGATDGTNIEYVHDMRHLEHLPETALSPNDEVLQRKKLPPLLVPQCQSASA